MKRIVAFLLLLTTGGAYLYSQQSQTAIDDAVLHRMNAAILVTVDEYIQSTSLAESSDTDAFPAMFLSPDSVCVYNDVPGTAHFNSMISPNAYAKLIVPGAGCIIQTDVNSVRKVSAPQFDGKYWHRQISLDKYVLYIDNTVYTGKGGGIFFDSDFLSGRGKGTVHLVLDMCYDQESGRCLIGGITNQGANRKTPVDGDSFYVVLRSSNPKLATPKYEDRTLYNGQPLTYNEYGQAFVGDTGEISFADPDYEIRVNEEVSSPLYKVVNLAYHKFHHYRIKPRAGFSPHMFSPTLSEAEEANFKVRSSAWELGADVGSMFIAGSMSRTGLYIGAALSNSYVTASIAPVTKTQQVEDGVDEEGNKLYRDIEVPEPVFEYEYPGKQQKYSIYSANERLHFIDLVVPVYLETEFNFGDMMDFSLDFGAKTYINLGNRESEPYSVQFNGTDKENTMDASSGFLFPASYAKEKFDLSLFANMEADIRIADKMFAFFSAGYEYGMPFLSAYRHGLTPEPYYSGSNNIYPVVRIGNNDVLRHSFVQSMSLNRSAFWMSLGIKVKLKY